MQNETCSICHHAVIGWPYAAARRCGNPQCNASFQLPSWNGILPHSACDNIGDEDVWLNESVPLLALIANRRCPPPDLSLDDSTRRVCKPEAAQLWFAAVTTMVAIRSTVVETMGISGRGAKKLRNVRCGSQSKARQYNMEYFFFFICIWACTVFDIFLFNTRCQFWCISLFYNYL